MTKQRSFQQRVGRRGEDAFRPFASRHGLLATKVEEDVGFDFLCQVEVPATTRTRSISGSLIGVSVRSSSARSTRVRIERSDAEAMLQANFVVCFVLVEVRSRSEQVWYRLLDERFALELADFLASEQQSRSMTPKHCSSGATFDRDLAAALQGNAPERVRLAVAHHRIARVLPDVALDISRDASGELTLVTVEDFYGYFLRSDVPEQDDAYAAIFGSPRLRLERLAELGPRPEVVRELARLPSPVLVGGTSETEFDLTAENSGGHDTASFTRVATEVHTGWVFDAGFSITISKSKRQGDYWIHEIDAYVDPDEDLDLERCPTLWKFLKRCTSDAVLFPLDDPEFKLEASYVRGLDRAGFFARCLQDAVHLRGWDRVAAPLRVSSEEEALHSMAWMAELATHPAVLKGFGFLLASDEGESEEETDLDEVLVRCDVPVIANLGDQAVVTWLDAEVTMFSNDDEVARGVRIDKVVDTSIEVRARREKATAYPELVIHGSWPVIALTGRGAERSESDAAEWDLELMAIRARD